MEDLSRNQLPELPDEIHCKIFSKLDLSTILKAREVSKKWKYLVPLARPNLHFICPLTDETYRFAVNSDEIFSYLEVQGFSGNGNEVMSPTSGTGFLFGNIDRIKFTGNEIAAGEIPKMMYFAVDSLKVLEFENCAVDTLRPFIEAKQTFNALQELSIKYNQFPTENDTLALEGISTPELGPTLPSLKRLKVFLDDQKLAVPSTVQEIFSTYLAIAKLIVKYRHSVTDIEIKRTSNFRRTTSWQIQIPGQGLGFELSQTQTTQLEQCLEAFQEMTLDKLYITPENAGHPWLMETELVRRQQNLKQLIIDQTVVIIRHLPNLTTWLPTNGRSLTSIKMTLHLHGPSSPIDLGAFMGCQNLKTLWLELFHELNEEDDEPIWTSSSKFTNVRALPKTISSLQLKSDNQNHDRDWKHQLFILSTEQVEWIINNLRELESLWVQLVPEPRRRNGDGQQQQQFPEQHINRQPNMTLSMFQDLISLPKLKLLKLDMLKLKQLEASIFDDEEDVVDDPDQEIQDVVISLDEIQDYIDVCPNAISVSRHPVQGQLIRFWELTIHTSNSTKVTIHH